MSFIKSKISGDKAEDSVSEILSQLGQVTKSSVSNRKLYDLKLTLPEKDVTFEVKFDIMTAKTGNVCIEYWNPKSNEPSGVMVSEADFWCHCIRDEIYITPLHVLMEFVRVTKPDRIIERCGDRNSDMFLYKEGVILPIFTRLDLLNLTDLTALLLKDKDEHQY